MVTELLARSQRKGYNQVLLGCNPECDFFLKHVIVLDHSLDLKVMLMLYFKIILSLVWSVVLT